MLLRKEPGNTRLCNMNSLKAALEDVMLTSPDVVAHLLQHGIKTCEWLTGTPSTVNGTDMGDQEWRSTLFLHCIIDPPDLPISFDRSSAAFSVSISHTLDFKKGGLVSMLWDVRYKWPSGAQFTFNCYRHRDTLVVHGVDGSGYLLHSK